MKERGKYNEAIEALTKYLDTYYDDSEGWAELCNLYLSQHLYEQAAFCCEELVILQPANHIWYLKYAEILYTVNNFPLALKHYCKVLELCTDNVRALYGLQLVREKSSSQGLADERRKEKERGLNFCQCSALQNWSHRMKWSMQRIWMRLQRNDCWIYTKNHPKMYYNLYRITSRASDNKRYI